MLSSWSSGGHCLKRLEVHLHGRAMPGCGVPGTDGFNKTQRLIFIWEAQHQPLGGLGDLRPQVCTSVFRAGVAFLSNSLENEITFSGVSAIRSSKIKSA